MTDTRQSMIEGFFVLAKTAPTQEAKEAMLTMACGLMREPAEVSIEAANIGYLCRIMAHKNLLTIICAWCEKAMGFRMGNPEEKTDRAICEKCKEKLLAIGREKLQ